LQIKYPLVEEEEEEEKEEAGLCIRVVIAL
jgi:hypothetical protein